MSNWQNRIVGYDNIDPSSLIPNPKNFREHPQYQKMVMSGILQEIGWIQNCIVNKRTMHLIDGHMRVLLAIEEKESTVPVTYVDLSDEEEQKALVTFDPVAYYAEQNHTKIAEISRLIAINSSNVRDLVNRLARNTTLLTHKDTDQGEGQPISGDGGAETESDEREIDNQQKEYSEKAIEEYTPSINQIWGMGNHFLIYGDCKNEAIVDYIKSNFKINAVNTDPPYGINVVGGDGRIGYGAKFGDIEGDKEPFDPTHILGWSDNIVLWGANHYSNKLPSSPCWLIWDKRDGDRHNDQADCEMAWCSKPGVVRIFSHLWMGFAKASEKNVARIHPTQKPIEVIKWSIEEKTNSGDWILDMYAGSCTTVLAGNDIGRNVIAVEKSPVYVASSLKRFHEYTGVKPKLIGVIK